MIIVWIKAEYVWADNLVIVIVSELFIYRLLIDVVYSYMRSLSCVIDMYDYVKLDISLTPLIGKGML